MTITIDFTHADRFIDYRLDCHCNSSGGVESIDIMSAVVWHGDYGLELSHESILNMERAAWWLLGRFGDEIQELVNAERQRERESRAADISERLNAIWGM